MFLLWIRLLKAAEGPYMLCMDNEQAHVKK